MRSGAHRRPQAQGRSTLAVLSCVVILAFAVVTPAGARQSAGAFLAAGDSAYARLDNVVAVSAYESAAAAGRKPWSFDLVARMSRTLNDYGMDLVAEGRKEEGEALLERAVELAVDLTRRFPERKESWFLLAAGYGNMALFKGGKEKVRLGRGIEEYCNKALEIDPAYSLPYAVLGIFYREVSELNWIQRTVANTLLGGIPDGSYELSERMLRRSVELDASIPLAHFELGRTLIRDGQTDEGRVHLGHAVSMKPITTLDVRNAEEARRLLSHR